MLKLCRYWIPSALWVLLLLAPAYLQAQQYVFESYRQADGLENLSVRQTTFDRQGFLWVATENGVYHFLGSGFKHYGPDEGIAERGVISICADPNGTVWVGTSEDLYRWNGIGFEAVGKEASTKEVLDKGTAHEGSFPIWNANAIVAIDNSHLLVIRKNKLLMLTHDSAEKILSAEPVFSNAQFKMWPQLRWLSSIAVASDGTYWMGCGYQICSYSHGKIALWGKDLGVLREFWLDFHRDREGTLWAAGEHHLLALASGSAQFLNRTPLHISPETVSRNASIVEDDEGRIVIATDEGLARWDDGNWQYIGEKNGLHTSHITSLRRDAKGDLWMGSIGHGLWHWAGYRDWEGWTDRQGLPSSGIWSINPVSRRNVLVGTEKGPAQIDLSTRQVSQPIPSGKWRYGQVSGLVKETDGNLLAATFSGNLLRVNPQTHSISKLDMLLVDPQTDFASKQEVIVASPYGILFDAPGHAWVTSDKNLFEFDASKKTHPIQLAPEARALFGAKFTAIDAACISPDGASWFLGDNRLVRFNHGQWSLPRVDGLSIVHGSQLVHMSCAHDGSIWMTGPTSGTWHLTPENSRMEAKRLPVSEEFSKLSPLAILFDSRGWVWLGTDNGLLLWNGISWRHITQENGLLWNDINQWLLVEGSDGSVWVGTSGGLSHIIHPEHLVDSLPLAISLTSIKRGNRFVPTKLPFTLPWAQSTLKFEFATPGWSRSASVFTYRLLGLDKAWIHTKDAEAIFPSLPPGSYQFEVLVSNTDLNTTSAITAISFYILPPWWRTDIAYGVYVLCGTLGLFALYRLRTRNLIASQQRLEALVSKRTQQLECSHEQLRIQAMTDPLTSLLNRGAILDQLAKELDRAQRKETGLIVILADIDHFKRVNDTYGHMAGDEALRRFSSALSQGIRPYDHAGRYGGEEFLILLSTLSADFPVERIAQLHAAASNLLIAHGSSSFSITCSFGAAFAVVDSDSVEAEALLSIADHALYEAKDRGRNCVVIAGPKQDRSVTHGMSFCEVERSIFRTIETVEHSKPEDSGTAACF